MTSSVRITSRQHPLVRQFRRAAAGPGADSVVLLDGDHLVREAFAAGIEVTALLSDGRHPDLLERAGAAGHACARTVMAAASPVRTPSGVCALARWRPADLHGVFATRPALVVGLVDVQDPGNVGSAIRSADALGATGVLTVGATADPGGWKVLRGSMGSTFRLPVGRSDLAAAVAHARRAGVRVLATSAAGGLPPDAADLASPLFILVGHEGSGLPPDVAADADEVLSIPMRPGIESLNVAVAAALLVDAARRQRAGSRR